MPGCADERSLASRLRLSVMRLNRRLRARRTNGSVAQPPSMTRVISVLRDMGYIEAGISAREAWQDARLSELDGAERETLARTAENIDRMAGQ